MAYTKLTPEEKQARKEAREEACKKAKAEAAFFTDLYWHLNKKCDEQGLGSMEEEAEWMIKEAFKAGWDQRSGRSAISVPFRRSFWA